MGLPCQATPESMQPVPWHRVTAPEDHTGCPFSCMQKVWEPGNPQTCAKKLLLPFVGYGWVWLKASQKDFCNPLSWVLRSFVGSEARDVGFVLALAWKAWLGLESNNMAYLLHPVLSCW